MCFFQKMKEVSILKIRGMVLTALSAILFGAIPMVTKILLERGMDVVAISFYRYVLIIPVMAGCCLMKRIPLKLTRNKRIDILIHASFFSTITMLLLNGSYMFIHTGIATTLHFLYPLFVIVICKFFYRDAIDKKTIRSLFIMLIGITCFMEQVNINQVQGLVLALLSAITYAIYLVQMEKRKLSHIHPLHFSLYLSVYTCILLMAVNAVTRSIHPYTDLMNFGFLFLISFMSLLSIVCLQAGAKHLGSKLVSLFSLFEPITSLLLGVIFLNETVQFMKIIGCILILCAVVYLAIDIPRKKG